MERIKLFTTNRIKLFSKPETSRIKFFSHDPEATETLKKVVCHDCGLETLTAANVSQLICPKCGGKRFYIKPEKEESVHPQDDFIEESELSKILKVYSGKSGVSEKTFSNPEDLIEKGFATREEDGNLTINPSAYELDRMFSKITVSITKELDLDDSIMKSPEKPNFEEILPDMTPKQIIILKKAHCIPSEEKVFCEEGNWLQDSSIVSDLKVEFANQSFGIKQFINMLNERYSDAPENVVDLLLSDGVISISNNQITVNK